MWQSKTLETHGKSSKSSWDLYASRSIAQHLLPEMKISVAVITKKLTKNHNNKKKIWLMLCNFSSAKGAGPMTYYVQETYGSQMLKWRPNELAWLLLTYFETWHFQMSLADHFAALLEAVGHIYFWQIWWSPKTSHKCETVKSDMCGTTCNRLSWQ